MTALVAILLHLLLGVGAVHQTPTTTPVQLHPETQPNGFAVLCDDNPAPLRTCIDATPATSGVLP